MSLTKLQTNVPTIKWDDNGVTIPEEDEIVNGFVQDILNIFPQALIIDSNGKFLLSTPLGQLITSWSAIVSDRNKLLAYYVNQVDPNYSLGRMQDGIGRIYFIERRPATYTEVVGLCRGKTGVDIPIGTQVKDNENNIYEAKQNYTIGDDGTVEVTFVCTELGAIECPIDSLSMQQSVIGWESVYNPSPGVIGRNLESQQQFEQRRRQSVAGNSVNSVDSIMAALLNLADANNDPVCQDAYATENSLGQEVTNGSVVLKPHSIFVCVVALDSYENQQAIAKTIWNKKPPGCAMNGDVSVIITDNSVDDNGNALYSTPPTYTITYQYAADVPIYFDIEMTRSQDQPKNAIDLIKNAIYSTFTGEDGSVRPRIGSEVLASDFFRPILNLGNWARIITVQIGRGSDVGNSITMGINEMPSLNKDNIRITFNG